MNIDTIHYVNDEQTSLRVTTVDGQHLTVPWPCRTWHNEVIQEWLDAGNEIALPPGPTLEQVRKAKVREINQAYQQELDVILGEYPRAETLSFDKQEREARTYLTYPESSTPFIDALAAARGLSKDAMVSRILTKADDFAKLSGAATGKRQALEDAAEAASDIETLQAIAW